MKFDPENRNHIMFVSLAVGILLTLIIVSLIPSNPSNVDIDCLLDEVERFNYSVVNDNMLGSTNVNFYEWKING